MEKVGIRELKQNASAVIARVKRGETIEVTDRGRPVAVISPLQERRSGLDALIAEGRASRPEGNLSDLPPPLAPTSAVLPSEILAALRSDER